MADPGTRSAHPQRSTDTLIKKRYSAFFETPLEALFDTLQPATLVIAGINTHACVRTTVIDAYQRDDDVIVASDCIGSYDAEHHDVTVRYLDGHMARFMSNDAVGQLLAATRDG